MKNTILSFVLDAFVAVVVSVLLIGLPRWVPGLTSGSILMPAFVAWWILSYRSAVPRWWMVLVIVLVDIFSSPRGALTVSFIAPALSLIVLDRLLPLQHFASAVLRAITAVLLFESSLVAVITLWLLPTGLPFPWSTFLFKSTVSIATTVVLLALLWNVRKKQPWLW